MTILTMGINLAKKAFAVHGVNDADKAALIRPAAPRDKLHGQTAAWPPCVIGMEACSRMSGAIWNQTFAATNTMRSDATRPK